MLALDLGVTTFVVAAVAIFLLVGLIGSLAKGDAYDQIGGGGLSMSGHREGQAPMPASGSPAERAERELEIRQMLQARNERLERQGEPPVDINAELARLLEPPPGEATAGTGKHDPELIDEVRQLVLARNERRSRSGEPPLDVETEIQRTLAELDPQG